VPRGSHGLSAISGAGGQEPPDVTCPEPELADGADDPLRPSLELDLDELDLDEPELLDVPLLELAEPEPPELVPAAPELADLEPEATRLAAAASADPGRV
jgi:hypothetical protein